MEKSTRNRLLQEQAALWMMRSAAFVVFASLVAIILTIVVKGWSSLSWEMLTSTPQGGYYLGKGGGILNAIAGSVYLALGSTMLAAGIGLPIALYLNVYASPSGHSVRMIRTALDVLFGVPSIVYGSFGFVLMLWIGIKVSLLAGIIVVGLLVVPIVARTMDEVLRSVRPEMKDAAFAMGATRWETAWKVVARQGLPGLGTAMLMGFGRAIGDAASVMFTTGFTDHVPGSIMDPAATLPLAIFFQLSSPVPEVRHRAYAAALVLTMIILMLSIFGRMLVKRSSKHTI
ncbi:MAG: phosphate ABC transporter permease PstA [Flavobacteriales bacterium]